jgi:hypothetical protein
MEIYKFLSAEHIDCMIRDGTIRIASLSYYRTREGEAWISDSFEGTTMVVVDHATYTNNESKPVGEPWRPNGNGGLVQVGSGGAVTFNNCGFGYLYPDSYIFCVSQGSLAPLIDAMCRNAKDRYNACVRIRVPLNLGSSGNRVGDFEGS